MGVDNNHEAAGERLSQQNETLFILRVIGIGNGERKWITEGSGGFLE